MNIQRINSDKSSSGVILEPNMPVKNICGRRIKEARRRLGLKQIEVVAIFDVDYGVNISRSALVRIENQSRAARDYELYILSRILKVPLSWLFEETNFGEEEEESALA